MKRSIVLFGLILAVGCGLHAQAAAPVNVNVCDVVKNPAAFDGKIVQIKGTVIEAFDEFAIEDSTEPNCGFQENAIWLSYPQGTKAKSGPAALVTVQPAHNFAGSYKAPTRTPVTLQKDKTFKQFDSLLSQTHQKGANMCLGCTRYEVTATFVGRLDGVSDATLKRDSSGKIVGFGGFGNMNAYPARLVLQSVSDVTSKEIDYSKADNEAKAAASQNASSQFMDPFDMGAKIVAHLAPSPAADEMKRAFGAFPKAKEQNGVEVSYGVANDVPSEEPGQKDSPDGILFNCTLSRNRLPGSALVVAMFHLGQHVADLRNPKPNNVGEPLIYQENDAWVVTSIAAIVGGQKYLTLPGGYLFWDASWPEGSRNDKMESVLKDFLNKEAMLSQ
ncbi:MAG: hypothetical protein ACP5E2_08795 [Terracidiphilus sp.]